MWGARCSWLVVLAGCYEQPEAALCSLTCAIDDPCPDGLECGNDGRCRAPGAQGCSCPSDDFADDELRFSKWSLTATEPGAPVPTLEDGELVLELPAMIERTGYLGIEAKRFVDFSDGNTITIDIPEGVSPLGFVENSVFLDDANGQYLISQGAGSLVCGSRMTGMKDETIKPFKAADHRYWRIELAPEKAVFSTSADGAMFEVCHESIELFPAITALRVRIIAGRFLEGNPEPGAARINDVRLDHCF